MKNILVFGGVITLFTSFNTSFAIIEQFEIREADTPIISFAQVQAMGKLTNPINTIERYNAPQVLQSSSAPKEMDIHVLATEQARARQNARNSTKKSSQNKAFSASSETTASGSKNDMSKWINRRGELISAIREVNTLTRESIFFAQIQMLQTKQKINAYINALKSQITSPSEHAYLDTRYQELIKDYSSDPDGWEKFTIREKTNAQKQRNQGIQSAYIKNFPEQEQENIEDILEKAIENNYAILEVTSEVFKQFLNTTIQEASKLKEPAAITKEPAAITKEPAAITKEPDRSTKYYRNQNLDTSEINHGVLRQLINEAVIQANDPEAIERRRNKIAAIEEGRVLINKGHNRSDTQNLITRLNTQIEQIQSKELDRTATEQDLTELGKLRSELNLLKEKLSYIEHKINTSIEQFNSKYADDDDDDDDSCSDDDNDDDSCSDDDSEQLAEAISVYGETRELIVEIFNSRGVEDMKEELIMNVISRHIQDVPLSIEQIEKNFIAKQEELVESVIADPNKTSEVVNNLKALANKNSKSFIIEDNPFDDNAVANLSQMEQAMLYVQHLQTQGSDTIDRTVQSAKEQGNVITTSLNTLLNIIDDLLNNRGNSVAAGIAAGDNEEVAADPNKRIWIRGFIGAGKQKSKQGHIGYHSNSVGATIGADISIGENDATLIGFAYSNARSNFKIKQATSNKFSTNSHIFSIYGQAELNKFLFQGSGSMIKSSTINKSRKLVRDNKYKIATGKSNNTGYHLRGLVNYKFNVNDLVLMPNIGFKYGVMSDGAYTESGSGVYNLSVTKKASRSLSAIVGIKASTKPRTIFSNTQIIPTLDLSVEKILNHKEINGEVKLRWANREFTNDTKSTKLNKVGYNLGASVLVNHNNTQISVGYNCHMRKNYNSHQGTLRLQLLF